MVEVQRQVEKLRGYYDLARDAVERAYAKDVAGQHSAAVQLYRTALNILLEGLALAVPSMGLDASHSNTARWRSDMNQWQQGVLDRLRALEGQGGPAAAAAASSGGGGGGGVAARSPPANPLLRSQRSAPRPRPAAALAAAAAAAAAGVRPGGGSKEDRDFDERVLSEVLDSAPSVAWDDVAGLAAAKQALQEMVILPTLRADLFQGLRAPARGLLLYGPPGAVRPPAARSMPLLHACWAACLPVPALCSATHPPLRFANQPRPPPPSQPTPPARPPPCQPPPSLGAGNGKTMLAKALAHEARATFFNISASSLTSRWHGDAEKLVRALFRVAARNQPSVIFIDEIDSILSERSSSEHEASRRLKTEFLVQFDGVASSSDRVVVIGATNRPWELDDAVRRRLPKRVYVPLPDAAGRRAMVQHLLRGQRHQLSSRDLERVVAGTGALAHAAAGGVPNRRLWRPASAHGYSGSDLAALCKEAAMVSIRELGAAIATAPVDSVRHISMADFVTAVGAIKPSVSREQLRRFEEWTRDYGMAS
ncbi:hypothetical protein CHLNCDRAFT_36318 [Chlorella variabilis]|uniref:microtubule-severing ATPase n=1 Tax=Chlorella variabilis TaxID=554065 RepID=E1ZK81_CHLVA|nr:hypothetical protein CHLNCDRAFT_36318 [Chlorella variabilis]EFN53758.1 hypothetical protein CHLNCDRAFT_36318 [Chlorella variabilis]|eukprot:XP_005845860.1 hypothetical protein CHLNCDRAFT_36318 [Chlorella variabilis]